MLGLASYLVFFAIVVLVLGVATLGLNLQWGATGLFNAGVVGFYGVGGYAFAILCAPPRPELLGNFGPRRRHSGLDDEPLDQAQDLCLAGGKV